MLWLGLAIIVVGIGVLGAWMRPRDYPGLRHVGRNAQGFEEYENLADGTVLIDVPAGTFQMGSNERDDEKPPHSVTVPSFFMARVPVTNAQFARFVEATGFDAGTAWRMRASMHGEQAPVHSVNWHDATAYCAWAGLRLPSEEEWEFAARGTADRIYPWGNEWDSTRCKNSVGRTGPNPMAPVGSFPSGASPCGCLDMAGNMIQWTSSRYDRYPGSSSGTATSDGDPSQTYRVSRGSVSDDGDASHFRGATRGKMNPPSRAGGFRCAR